MKKIKILSNTEEGIMNNKWAYASFNYQKNLHIDSLFLQPDEK